ncbi:MAG: ATP-binding protein [Eubacteriales bacterium]|nr:ATP-binding protein [Eubacteriales bacterium]
MRRFHHILHQLFVIVLALVLCAAPWAVAYGAQSTKEARIVRVAFPKQAGFSEIGIGGNYSGYTYDYLEKIAEYTGFTFQYITFDDMSADEAILAAMEMVRTGEADLIGGIIKSDQLEQVYDFCETSYGVVYTTLSALENNTSVSEDTFRGLSPLRVAIYDQATTRNNELVEYLSKEGVTYELVPCKSRQEQVQALENQTADVASSISLSYFTGTKTLARFAARPYYFATTKGNADLLRELDTAQINISYAFPYFQSKLQDKYFGDNAGGFSLSAQQVQTLQDKKTLDVLCIPDSAPYVTIDQNGNPSGVLVSIMDKFALDTGLSVTYHVYNKDALLQTAALENQYDIILSIPVSLDYNSQMGFIRSRAVDTVDMVAFEKPTYSKALQDSTVALVQSREQVPSIDCKDIIYCENVKECIRIVNAGKADIGFDNRQSVAYYIYDLYANLVTTPMISQQLDICFLVSTKVGNEFLAILNNYVRNIGADQLAEFYSMANTHNQKNAIELMARSNPLQMVFLICVFIVALFTAVFLAVSSGRKKRQYALLQNALAAKDEFLARMSHDMRTPMNAIIGFSDIGIDASDFDEQQECLHKIKDSGRYLLGLINDVLDMSKMEEGKLELHPEPYLYAEFKQSILTILLPKAQEKGVEFIIDDQAFTYDAVEFDKLRIQQVFVNLIGNALKFTPPGGKVEFILSTKSPQADGTLPLIFEIRDNGVGMSEQFITDKLFHPFEQEHRDMAQSEVGTGLGLSIVKRLLDQMGGTIECHSQPGQGTVFIVKLQPKLVKSYQQIQAAESHDFSSLYHKRVLLCEDHPLNTQIAVKLLEKQNMLVEVAQNGQLGLDVLLRHEPSYFNAILMDIRMPVMDGLETARAIRALDRPDAQSIPIIAMTANAFDEDVLASKNAGMNAHLAKPIEPQKLYETLQSYLS